MFQTFSDYVESLVGQILQFDQECLRCFPGCRPGLIAQVDPKKRRCYFLKCVFIPVENPQPVENHFCRRDWRITIPFGHPPACQSTVCFSGPDRGMMRGSEDGKLQQKQNAKRWIMKLPMMSGQMNAWPIWTQVIWSFFYVNVEGFPHETL